MGFAAWWNGYRRRASLAQHALEMTCDARAMTRMAPEIAGMSAAQGGRYVRQRIAIFQECGTPGEAATLATRLSQAQRMWEGQGLPMPYWGDLVVLRTLQAEIAVLSPDHAAPAPPARHPARHEAEDRDIRRYFLKEPQAEAARRFEKRISGQESPGFSGALTPKVER
jgi:hypothetical protein